MRIRQYVYFALWSETTSASTITEALGVAPDATLVRGSRRADPPVPARHRWALECADRDLDIGQQITRVLARVRPIAPRIGLLIKRCDVISGLNIVRYFDDEDGQLERIDTTELADGTQLVKVSGQHQLLGWHIDLTDLQLLVSLECSLDVDEYN